MIKSLSKYIVKGSLIGIENLDGHEMTISCWCLFKSEQLKKDLMTMKYNQTFQNYPWLFICQWEGSFKLARKLLLFVFPRKVNDSISTLHLKLAIKFWHPRHKVILLCSKGCMYILESYQEGIWTCRDRGKTKEILKLAYRG